MQIHWVCTIISKLNSKSWTSQVGVYQFPVGMCSAEAVSSQFLFSLDVNLFRNFSTEHFLVAVNLQSGSLSIFMLLPTKFAPKASNSAEKWFLWRFFLQFFILNSNCLFKDKVIFRPKNILEEKFWLKCVQFSYNKSNSGSC